MCAHAAQDCLPQHRAARFNVHVHTPVPPPPTPQWNFEKFLVSRTGEVVERFSSLTTPASLEEKIEKLLWCVGRGHGARARVRVFVPTETHPTSSLCRCCTERGRLAF